MGKVINLGKGFRTVAFTIVMAILMFATLAGDGSIELPSQEDIVRVFDTAEGLLISVWAMGSVILRALTTAPIFKKNEPEVQNDEHETSSI